MATHTAEQLNPLDRYLTILVTEAQITSGATIDVRVPGDGSALSFRLKPEMRGKLVRLRYAVSKGAGHLFLRFQIAEVVVRPAEQERVAGSSVGSARDLEKSAELRRRLRLITLGDEARVERLIEFERTRSPGLSLVEAMRVAIERWERDNR